MRVLVIAASLSPFSGWGRYSCSVIEELVNQGVDVQIMVEDVGEGMYRAQPLLALSSGLSAVRLLRNFFRCRHAASGVDIVHSFDGWPYALYGWAAVIGTRRKLFVSGIATYSIPPGGHSLKSVLFRIAYRRTSKILSVSEYTKNRLISSGVSSSKIEVIYMGASRLPAQSKEKSLSFLSRVNINTDAYPLILTVGQIKDRKGQFDTLRAVEKLRDVYPHILYVMAGRADPGYVQAIRSFINEKNLCNHVRIVEGVSDEELACLYERSDVVALNANTDEKSRHFEGFGLSILEGYQFGKPGVGSRGSGVQEAIQHGITGTLSLQRDPEDIAENIQRIMTDYALFARGAAKAYESFNWKKTVEAYMKEYER